MGPRVLNSAGQGDRRPFGQGGGAEINLVVGQLSADPGIEGAVVLGLRKREARRRKSARKHAGECASRDVHGQSLPVEACFRLSNPYSGRCTTRYCSCQLRPFGGFATMDQDDENERRSVMEESASRRRFLQDMTALGAASGVSAALGATSAGAQESLQMAQAQPASPSMLAADNARPLPRIQLLIGPGT